MKNDYEMYRSLLSRYDEYQVQKKKRAITIRRTVTVLTSYCFALLLGFWFIDYFSKLPDIPIQPDIISETSETTTVAFTTQSTSTDKMVVSDIVPSTTVSVSATKTEQVSTAAIKQTKTVKTTDSNITLSANTRQTPTIVIGTQPPVKTSSINETNTTIKPQTTIPIQITKPSSVTTVNTNIRELLFGYSDGSDNSGNHQPSAQQKIVMKCLSFCDSDKTLKVDTAMADVGISPPYYDVEREYEYEVFVCNPLNSNNIEDEKFIVNGEFRGYKKEYSRDDTALFDVNGKDDNYDLYHHETTEIDFSSYEIGNSGCILFSFTAVYKDDSLNSSYKGSKQFMYFYVGEKGTSISNISIEDAIDNYKTVIMS